MKLIGFAMYLLQFSTTFYTDVELISFATINISKSGRSKNTIFTHKKHIGETVYDIWAQTFVRKDIWAQRHLGTRHLSAKCVVCTFHNYFFTIFKKLYKINTLVFYNFIFATVLVFYIYLN